MDYPQPVGSGYNQLRKHPARGDSMNEPSFHSDTIASRFLSRQAQLATALYTHHLDVLALNPGPSLTYLTGLNFHLMERPVVGLFTPHNPVILILPELEAGKTANLRYPIQVFPYGEDPAIWLNAFRQAALAAQLEGRRVGVEPGRMRVLELRMLEAAAETAEYLSAEESLAELRMRKDQSEIEAMRTAAQIAQQALNETLPKVETGVRERELAAELTMQLLRAGSDVELPFAPIVSSGPNGANPHAVPSERQLQAGDLLVVDWGAAYQGYFSDITRTFAIGEIEDEFRQIAAIVRQANQAGRAAVRPGVTAHTIDQAARDVIEKAGYGQFFTHRTGHGLGMEAHEAPYMRARNTRVLEAGMTFTIEPGIYLPGRGGVRIEDDVVVTEDGGESLTDMPRELVTLG
jgi:Xaa-Pro dipeptidase